MPRQPVTQFAPVLLCHRNHTKYMGDAYLKRGKKNKLENMQMKRVGLTDRMGRMFGHAC